MWFWIIVISLLVLTMLWLFYFGSSNGTLDVLNNVATNCNGDATKLQMKKKDTYDEYINRIMGLCAPKRVKSVPLVEHREALPSETKRFNNKFKQSESNAERRCRDIFQSKFNEPFESIRHPQIRNPKTNKCLELDGYNEDLKLAFEYNGEQHYIWPNYLSRKGSQTEEQFNKQCERDEYKKKRCKELNIDLITIPYTVPYGMYEDYIDERIPTRLRNRLV